MHGKEINRVLISLSFCFFILLVVAIQVQAIAQLGMSFHDWLKLSPEETKPDGAELMYIIPSKPLEV